MAGMRDGRRCVSGFVRSLAWKISKYPLTGPDRLSEHTARRKEDSRVRKARRIANSESNLRHGGRPMTDLLIQNGTVITMESGCEVLSGGAIAVRDGRIAAVGKPADLKRMGFGEGKTLNARGHAVLPGLVNAHAHAASVLLKGLPEDTSARARMQRVLRLIFKEADAPETQTLARASFLRGHQKRRDLPGDPGSPRLGSGRARPGIRNPRCAHGSHRGSRYRFRGRRAQPPWMNSCPGPRGSTRTGRVERPSVSGCIHPLSVRMRPSNVSPRRPKPESAVSITTLGFSPGKPRRSGTGRGETSGDSCGGSTCCGRIPFWRVGTRSTRTTSTGSAAPPRRCRAGRPDPPGRLSSQQDPRGLGDGRNRS